MKTVGWYYLKRVTQDDMNDHVANIEDAVGKPLTDHGLVGVISGLTVAAQGTPDRTVRVLSGVATSRLGRRIRVPSAVDINTAIDRDGNSTDVFGALNERWLTVTVTFARSGVGAVIDGFGDSTFETFEEGYLFEVWAGAEAAVGFGIPPAVGDEAVILADLKITNADAIIDPADINTSRRDVLIDLQGGDFSYEGNGLIPTLQEIVDDLNSHGDGTKARHSASDVDADQIASTWADASTIAAGSVESQLDDVVGDLGATTGSDKIGAAAQIVGAESVADGTIASQVTELLTSLGDKVSLAGTNVFTGPNTFSNRVVSPIPLTEAVGSTRKFNIRVPSGWNTAASADATMDAPPQANIPSGSEFAPTIIDTYTPIITQGITSITYTTQQGFYQRIGHVVHVSFAIAWSAGTTSGSNLLISLPLPATLTVRGINLPALAMVSHGGAQLQGGASAGMYHCYHIPNSNMGFRAGATQLTGTNAGSSNTLTGSFSYWTSP